MGFPREYEKPCDIRRYLIQTNGRFPDKFISTHAEDTFAAQLLI